jgi:hypothetical protein
LARHRWQLPGRWKECLPILAKHDGGILNIRGEQKVMQPSKNRGPAPTADEARMLIAIAKFGPIHPVTQTDIGLIKNLEAAGYVVKDPKNPEHSLTVRGWEFVRGAAKKGE